MRAPEVSNFQRSTNRLRTLVQPKSLAHSFLYPLGVPATVGLGALGLAGEAEAGVINVTPVTPITLQEGISSANWDIDGDLTTDIRFIETGGDSFCLETDNALLASIALGGDGNDILPITDAMTVGPANSFGQIDCVSLADTTCNHTHYNNFILFPEVTSETNGHFDFSGILGFRFDNNGTINYGVARFLIEGIDGELPFGSFSITEWAYDDSGAAISGTALNDAVPEPGTLALAGVAMLASGAAGLRRRRRLVG